MVEDIDHIFFGCVLGSKRGAETLEVLATSYRVHALQAVVIFGSRHIFVGMLVFVVEGMRKALHYNARIRN